MTPQDFLTQRAQLGFCRTLVHDEEDVDAVQRLHGLDRQLVGIADADADDENLLHAGLVASIQAPVQARRVVEKASRAEKAMMPTATQA